MAGIKFEELAERFAQTLRLAGGVVLYTSDPRTRPVAVTVLLGGVTYRLEAYLWSITPGGKGRGRPRERRIQLTGVSRFSLKAGIRGVLGGWSDEVGVFAFWDMRRHLGFREGSPSLQISLDTLEQAAVVGLATEIRSVREGSEIAVAVQPDYLHWYIEEYQQLYDCGVEAQGAADLVRNRPEDDRQFIDSGENDNAQSRRHLMISVVRNFRAAQFRPLVLRAYSYRCCLTGMSLRLVDAAHIVPVSDPTSTDEPRNGVALNPLLHRAYDCGLLGLLPGGFTAINKRLRTELGAAKLDAGIKSLEGMIPRQMTMPGSPEFHPPDDYLYRGLQARGWTDEDIRCAS